MLARTLLSASVMGAFALVALGSGTGGSSTPVSRVTVPALSMGTQTTLTLSVDNQTDEAFDFVSLTLSDEFASAVTLNSASVPGAGTPVALQPGDGWQITTTGSVPKGGTQQHTVVVTPRVPGKFDGRIALCAADGSCSTAPFTATVPGQPVALRQVTVDMPQSVPAGAEFEFSIKVDNNGTLPDEVSKIELPEELLQQVGIGQIDPLPSSMKEPFGDKELRFETGLKPGRSLLVKIQATATGTGGVTDNIEVCGPGGMFDCHEEPFAITIEPGAASADTDAPAADPPQEP